MSKKNTRRALLSSALALLLCVSMLIGSTFAWFTDEVVSSNNIIKSGTLDITMGWADGTKAVPTTEDGWTDASTGAIFNYNKWEPGYTEVRHVKIANVGTLALKYVLNIVPTGEVSDLADVIDVYYVDPAVQVADRTALDEDYNIGTLTEVLAGMASTAVGELKAGESVTVTLALKMQEEAGNEYQDKSIGSDFAVQLMATQLTAESDSFGPDYDAGAYLPVVYTAEELKNALENNKSVMLGADITLTGEWTPIGDKDAGIYYTGTLDGNGYTISGLTVTSGDYVALISAAKDATVKNLTVEGTVAGENAAGIVARVEGNTVIEDCVSNVTVSGTTKAGGIACNVTGADAKIINCTNNANISGGDSGIGGIVGYVNNNANLEIINCVNTGNVTSVNNKYAGAAVGYGAGTSTGVVVGFSNSGVVTGTLLNDGRYLKDGDTVLCGYVGTIGNWTCAKSASTAAELQTVLSAAAAAGAGDTVVYLTGDIDLTDTAWTPIEVDGYAGAGVVTVEGNGATITGLSAPLFAGGFAGKSGIVIKDLTIADSNIISTSGLGGGAFVDTADSMHVITLENCHLVNSTVSGERTGGLIGWCGDYARLDDGPVKAYVTITDCSVVGSTVIGAGSAGGIAGHPGASDYTYTTIEDCAVKNVNVISNDEGSWRTGAVVGTANNGHIVINDVTVENVTLTQNGVVATETKLYGRFVPAGTGTLVIDGVAVLEQSALTPDMIASFVPSSNKEYALSGDFDNANVSIVMPVGVENVVFDGTNATNINELIITQNGALIDNATAFVGDRSGKVTIQNFNVASQIDVFAAKTEVEICYNTAEALSVYAGNCKINIHHNTFDANFETHSIYRDATNVWSSNDYGVQLRIFDYDLYFDNNTVTDAKGHVVGLNGYQATFDIAVENKIHSFTGNTITVNSAVNNNRAAFKIWADYVYAPQDNQNAVNTEAQAFIDSVLASGGNTFNITEGYGHTIFCIYNVNTDK